MPKLLLSLKDVPVDEYDEVCALLDGLSIEHYRTEPSRWGISSGALWLVDESRHAEARAALDAYQRERGERARAERAAALAAGNALTFASQLREQPLRTGLLLIGLVLIIALSLLPFLWMTGVIG